MYDDDDLDDEWDHEDDDESDEDGDEDDDEAPLEAFVSMALGRPGCDEVYRVIRKVCKHFDVVPQRAHVEEFPGSYSIEAIIEALVDRCDFAIIDLTYERPSVAHEIGLCDREFDKGLIVFIAKAGTPRFGNIQSRGVVYYDSPEDLEKKLRKKVEMALDILESEDDEADEDEEGPS